MTLCNAEELVSIELSNVQETLLTPLCARAEQFDRSDPIIIDETAKRLVDSIKYDFDKIRQFPNTLTGCAIRASLMDEWIQAFLKSNPTGSVGLFGVGLDTVFERNDNGHANWFEFDFEDVIALRNQCFQPHPRRQTIAGDIFDEDWIASIKAKSSGPWLFQAAGLLMYLKPEQVTTLFELLLTHFPGCLFLFDGCSNFALKNSHRWEATIRTTAAKYHWAIDDPRNLSAWDERIQITDVRYLMDYHRQQWRWDTRFWSRLMPKLRKAYHVNRSVLGSTE